MFFGQETNGWGAELSNIEDIPSAMSEYERFNMGAITTVPFGVGFIG